MSNPLRIGEVCMAVAKDEDGNEGLCAVHLPDGRWCPLISADPERFEFVEEHAGALARLTGKTIHIIRMTKREEVGFIAPFGDDAISLKIKRPQ